MTTRIAVFFALACSVFLCASNSQALSNRHFVSAINGNDSNNCSNILTPCLTFAGAVLQLNPGGETIVLTSGGYGPVTITQALTIEAPAGVTAFIHPPSGSAITVNAGLSDVVTLRGLVLSNSADSFGINVTAVGTLNVENCFITGFGDGIYMVSAGGRLNLKGTDITAGGFGIDIVNTAGLVQTSIDHCHLDGNIDGFFAESTSPGLSTTTATNSTANNNSGSGWVCGNDSSGQTVLNLEFCAGSENGVDGLSAVSMNALSAARYSNCVFTNNMNYGVYQAASGVVESRGNNTITGNAAATSGTIGSFPAM